jgi:hypothetical protein
MYACTKRQRSGGRERDRQAAWRNLRIRQFAPALLEFYPVFYKKFLLEGSTAILSIQKALKYTEFQLK